MRLLLLVALLVLGTFFTIAFATQQDDKAALIVIDVRTETEWKDGHLEGAVLIPHDQIETGITTLTADKKTKIHLYCRTGKRTGIAMDVLKKIGYEDLINLGTMESASKTLHRAIVK